MTPDEIKKTWKKLLIPLFFGLILLIVSILFHRLGSKQPRPQTLSFFAGIAGAMLVLFSGYNIFKFKKFLNDSKQKN